MRQNKKWSAAQCLALVEQSPQAVAAHDESAWMAIFANQNTVEDPVGSAPHHSNREGAAGFEPLHRFYQTFIAANKISFQVRQDIVCGLWVMRDLTITIEMVARFKIAVPMHLLYELEEQGGELKIRRLAAHWELRPMLGRQLKGGWRGLVAGTLAGWRLLRYLGISGTIGFSQALSSVGEPGKQQVIELLASFNEQQLTSVANWRCLVAAKESPELLTAAHLSVEKVLAAGLNVTASCQLQQNDQSFEGVMLVTFSKDHQRIETVLLMLDSTSANIT